MPAVANEKLGQEDQILVRRDCLAVLVEEGVLSGLDVLLVLGVILLRQAFSLLESGSSTRQ